MSLVNKSPDITDAAIERLAEELANMVSLIQEFVELGISETEIHDLIFDTIRSRAPNQAVAKRVSSLIGKMIGRIFHESDL